MKKLFLLAVVLIIAYYSASAQLKPKEGLDTARAKITFSNP